MSAPLSALPQGRDALLKTIDSLPPLPAVALRVMQVAQDARSSASELAVVVSADPGLSARILRIVNSAAYRRAQDVTSIQQALVVLGFVQARNVAISSAITSAYAPDALNALFRIDRFWRHSIAVAFRAAGLAPQRRQDPPSAFTAGILHGMGRLALFFADPAGLDQAVAATMAHDVALEVEERELLGVDVAELGGMLADKWRLPAAIRDAVARQHDEGLDASSLAALLAESDQFCRGYGIYPGYVIPGREPSPPPEELRRLLVQVDTLMELVQGQPVGVRGA